jgi:hypothetical protein
MQGAAALTLMTAAERPGKPRPYEDEIDLDGGAILYHYRAGTLDQPDNRALEAAHELQSPLIYFKGMAPGQYVVIAPVFVRVNDATERVVLLDKGLEGIDTQPAARYPRRTCGGMRSVKSGSASTSSASARRCCAPIGNAARSVRSGGTTWSRPHTSSPIRPPPESPLS